MASQQKRKQRGYRPRPTAAAYFSWETPLYESDTKGANSLISELHGLEARLKPILDTISQYLPDLTIHNTTHIKELRRLTDEFVRADALTALEVYCLNVAYLIHDAGLSPIIYEGGPDAVRSSDTYYQLVAVALREKGQPATQEFAQQYVEQHPRYSDDLLFFPALRVMHAKKAETLIADFRRTRNSGASWEYLIDNEEFRKLTSNICGPIAASHHVNRGRLADLLQDRSFPRIQALTDFENADLVVRDLYLGTILRLVDACQLEGRAPAWYRLLQAPSGDSRLHWDFQEELTTTFQSDEIKFKLFTQGCPIQKAKVWWMGYDYIRNYVLPEITFADRLTLQKGYPPFR
jgi:hypothetical protein